MRLNDVVLVDQVQIHTNALIGDDFDGVKESLKPGTLDLGGLLGGFAFGEENHSVAAGEIGQRFRHAIQHARRSVFEFGDHRSNLFQRALLGQTAGELHVALLERTSKTAQPVAVLLNIVPLGFVQDVPRIGPGIAERLNQREKTLQGMLEKDVALPEGVIRVDEQSQAPHGHMGYWECVCSGSIPFRTELSNSYCTATTRN